MKNEKAARIDGIKPEMLKYMDMEEKSVLLKILPLYGSQNQYQQNGKQLSYYHRTTTA